MRERLQKIIAGAGLCSRRAAEELIAQGRVTVNGVKAQTGQSADAETDLILVDGERLPGKKSHTYVMLNKPKGYVTTMHDDQGRPTVAELVRLPGKRLYPVGRLDMYSEGLLIMTDDGETANRLMHPSHQVAKTYIVDVVGEDLRGAVRAMGREMDIDGCMIKALDVQLIRQGGGRGQLSVTIGEGRNRQVRKMCAQCGLKLQRLARVSEGALELGDLTSGKWRYLTAEEVRYLTTEL